MFRTHDDVGRYGEALVRALLAQIAPVEKGVADIRWLDCDIEVKTARPSKYNGRTWGYQFFLRGVGRHKTDYRRAQVLVLIGLDDEDKPVLCYVLPVEKLADRDTLKVSVRGRAGLAEWEDRWELLAQYVGAEPGSELGEIPV